MITPPPRLFLGRFFDVAVHTHGSCCVVAPEQRVDVFYLSTWITFFQVLIGFLLIPVNSLLPSSEGGVALSNVGTQFERGVSCLLGHNSVLCNLDSCAFFKEVWSNGTQLVFALNATAVTSPLRIATCYEYNPMFSNHGNPNNGLPQCDACQDAWWVWGLFIFFVFAYNVLLLKVVKYGSAAFMYAANAVTLPLVNVLGTSAAVMGAGQASSLNMFTVVGMGLTLAGLFLWAVAVKAEERKAKPGVGSPIMTGRARFAMNLNYATRRRVRVHANSLARDPMTVRKQLYSRLGVSSPGPGRVGAYVWSCGGVHVGMVVRGGGSCLAAVFPCMSVHLSCVLLVRVLSVLCFVLFFTFRGCALQTVSAWARSDAGWRQRLRRQFE